MSETTTFELRKLKSDDVFPMFKIISKIGLKEIKEQLDPATLGKIANAFQKDNEDVKAEDMVYRLFLDIDGEVCCSNAACKETQQAQKEAIYREITKEYSDIKRSYDAYVRRYKSYLVTARIDTLYPDKFDKFMQAKEERQAEMSRLKRRLINYGLPSEELYELGEKFKREIRVIAERILQ